MRARQPFAVVALVIPLLGLLAFPPPAPATAGRSLQPGLNHLTLAVDGRQRTGLVYLPTGVTGSTPLPVVIVLHGAGGDARSGLGQGHWQSKAEREGFLVVGLDGTPARAGAPPGALSNPRLWNDGRAALPETIKAVDDIAFLNATLDYLIATTAIDEERVYITGFSNGAAMAYRSGLQLSERVAAIAPVSSTLFAPPAPLQRPVSLLMIFGLDDPIHPPAGGSVRLPWPTRPDHQPSILAPAEDSWTTWASLLRCPRLATTVVDQPPVTARAYAPCQGNSEALSYTVAGMGHSWPGGRALLPEQVAGRPSDALSATDLIWDFFARHPRQPREMASSPATGCS